MVGSLHTEMGETGGNDNLRNQKIQMKCGKSAE